MERTYIVGAEHGHPASDFDTLMNVGGEPAPRQFAPAPSGYGPPPAHYPPQPHYPVPHYAPPAGYAPQPHYQEPAPQHYPPPQPVRHIVRRQATVSRDFPVGFTRANVQYNEMVDIEVKPQVLFKGKRLAVAPNCSRFFTIVDIKVGKDSQLAASGEMSAECFSALAVGVEMELDTAEPGIVITIRVRNSGDSSTHASAGPQNFDAVLYGAVMT